MSCAVDVRVSEPPTLEQARNYLLNSLTHAPKTRKQLADMLDRRNVPPEIALVLLDRFEELKLIDDAEYAQAWVRYRHSARGLTRRMLRQELIRKGVGQLDIELALEQVDQEDELAVAYELATRKIAAMSGFDVATQERKLTSMLIRRGHPVSVAGKVAREVVARTLSQ